MLNPNPPNDIFATPIATKLPTIIIQIGRFEGKLKANKMPVNKAEPSFIVTAAFNRYF